jgi:hypothetical protein
LNRLLCPLPNTDLMAVNMSRILLALTILILSSLCIAGEIPFTLEKGFLVVSAKINKDFTIEAVISTGSPDSFLDTGFTFEHKITPHYTSVGPVMGHDDKTLLFADNTGVILGDEKSVSLPMKLRSFETIDKKIGRHITAMLGSDYFKGKILQIDFQKKVLRFFDRSPTDYKAVKQAGPAEGRPLIFKMDQQFDTTFGESITLPVAPDVVVNGSKIRAMFDTGQASAVVLSPAAVKDYGFGVPPDKGTVKPAEVKSMSLDGYELSNVPVLLLGKEAGFDKELKEYGAMIGLGILHNFTVTFDWKEKKIVLQR